MSLKSSSSVFEVPVVVNAVQHLQELGCRMKSDDYGFKERDINNIDRIIEALNDLQVESEKIHEALETETIKASVLRHQLQFLPGQIKSEIQGAVSSARQSNAEELTRLQTTLDDINNKIKSQQDRYKFLEKENALLHPERDQVRDKHEDIISQLNQRMAEKASKQIVLNETRDKLRETNQKIVDLEEGIIQLKEDLVQERADARMEKKRLKKAVYDTTIKTREQKEINVVKKKELDVLKEKVFESESKLDEIRKSIRHFEASRASLENQERTLTIRLAKQIQTNESLQENGQMLAEGLEDQESSYQNLKEDLEGQVKDLKKNLKSGEKKKKELGKEKAQLEESVKEKMQVRQLDEGRVRQQNNILQEAKQDLAWKAEDAARLRQENMDMETRIVDLGETHESIVATFQKQIEEMRTQLSKERKERMTLQGQRDSVQKEVDDFRVETQRYINDQTKKINEGKVRHDELTREGTSLQKQIRSEEEELRRLQTNLVRARTDLDEYRSQNEGEVSRIQQEISDMTEKSKKTEATIIERSPSFEEFEKFYEKRTDDYEKLKKSIVAMKNKKLGLDDAVKRAGRDVEKLVAPTAKLREDIKLRRAEYLEQLKTHSTQRSEIEKNIYTTGSKLRTVMDENDRFREESSKLEQQITDINKDMSDTDAFCKKLDKHVDDLKDQLIQEWSNDRVLENEFATRDQNLVDELGKLLREAEKREQVIGGVTSKLQSELLVLSQFLENVAKRRPKESGSQKKKKTPRSGPRRPASLTSTQAGEAIDMIARANTEMNDLTQSTDKQNNPTLQSTAVTPRNIPTPSLNVTQSQK